jgi:hypothetical protein
MIEPDNFIRRWARLKRASDTAYEIKTVSAKVEATTPQPQAEGAPDQPFDLANLPPLASITADSDIGAFLQSGVPAELTRATLRRAWASDPAIRDFIGIAENQWDFNDPDGIPGFGPLPASDSAPSLLTGAPNKLANIPEALQELPVSVERDPSCATCPKTTPNEGYAAEPGIADTASQATEAAGATMRDRAVEEYDVVSNRRQHGSALPR